MALQQQRLRGLIAAAALLGCGAAGEGPDEISRYLDDPGFRRETLVRSLVAPQTPYAQLRLRRYATGDAQDWSALPVWDPPAAPLREGGEVSEPARPLGVAPEATRGDLAALRALGERAFWRYPAQLAPDAVARATSEPDRLEAAGFSREGGALVGLLRVRLPDGGDGVALSCAACHAGRLADGSLAPGLANDRLDLGALSARDVADPSLAARLRAWGPGRVDVTTGDGSEPVAIPDLRPVRFQRFLHRAGAVEQRSLASLAVRVETLLITSLHGAVRPPREVAAGLAVYLYGLGDAMQTTAAQGDGARVFAERCARCHAGEGMSGGLVAADEVGTDPAIARSVERGTGSYRVPSLRGVGARRGLLHDGAARDLEALLDPRRLDPGYAGGRRGVGAIPGHAFGLELSGEAREALVGFLSTR
ncbi:MAG: hypothetical protein R3A48_24140 [Polyangiales bacterium]